MIFESFYYGYLQDFVKLGLIIDKIDNGVIYISLPKEYNYNDDKGENINPEEIAKEIKKVLVKLPSVKSLKARFRNEVWTKEKERSI